MKLKIYCTKCKVDYRMGIIEYLFKNNGCPICKDKRFGLALGKWDKIR